MGSETGRYLSARRNKKPPVIYTYIKMKKSYKLMRSDVVLCTETIGKKDDLITAMSSDVYGKAESHDRHKFLKDMIDSLSDEAWVLTKNWILDNSP